MTTGAVAGTGAETGTGAGAKEATGNGTGAGRSVQSAPWKVRLMTSSCCSRVRRTKFTA